MKKPPVHVFAASVAAGSLTRSDVESDTILFGYREGTKPENAVSITMPVRADQYDSMGGLLPLFEMNLPEGALRERLRLHSGRTIPESDALHLLQIVGTSQTGRVRYSLQDSIDENVPTQDLSEILT